MRVLAAAAVLLSGCALNASWDGTEFACDETSDCPDGFSCVDNQCLSDDPGDVDPASCSDASDVTDDFDGDVEADWVPFATEGADTGQDGDAYVVLTGDVPAAAGYMSRCSFDMRSDSVYIEVEQLGGGDAETFFEVVSSDADFAAIVQHGNVLAMRTKGANGNSTRTESSTLDSAQQWWRIEGAGTAVHFYTASAEGDWILISTHDIPDGFDAAHVSFGLRNEDDEDGTPIEARFDNYNGG